MNEEQKKGRVTIHDLARILNTTASTVSRALQDHPRISRKMKDAVRELAEKMNYHPNIVASNLRRGKGNTVGVIVPHVNRHFFSSVIAGIEEVANASGYNVIICQSYESYEKECANLKILMQSRVDGIMASISKETRDYKHFEMVKDMNIPMVFFDRVPQHLDVNKVMLNDFDGAFKATAHLLEQGCRNIVHLAGPLHINVYDQRLAGYKKALNKYGIPFDERRIFKDTITRDTGRKAAEKLYKENKLPDAIFAAGDYSALGAILCLKEKGVKVPGDVSIIGFANEPFASLMDPPLSSVEQHGGEMGRRAAQLFIEEVEDKSDKKEPSVVYIEPKILIRESSLK